MKRAGIGAPVVGCGKLPRGMGMAFQLENDSFQSILKIIIFFSQQLSDGTDLMKNGTI